MYANMLVALLAQDTHTGMSICTKVAANKQLFCFIDNVAVSKGLNAVMYVYTHHNRKLSAATSWQFSYECIYEHVLYIT